jgi:hypothetical protein
LSPNGAKAVFKKRLLQGLKPALFFSADFGTTEVVP